LANVGGAEYIAELAAADLAPGSTRAYGRLIYELHLRRQLIHLGHTLVENASQASLEKNPSDFIEEAEQSLYDLATTGSGEKTAVSFEEALTKSLVTARNAFKRQNRLVGITSGLSELDKWLGGLHPSDLLILAGRPSMGKTALATNIAFNAAKALHRQKESGAATVFFSLEMSDEQLAMRMLSSESGVVSDKIRRGELTDQDFNAFADVSRELGQLPLFIDDTPALTLSALRTRARRLKRKENIGLIVIDYLQLLQIGGSRRSDNRVQELSEITRGLKALAKELHVPIIALSQLSRAVESRDDKRPQLADLRESGSIEQDADVVMFVYRQAYYEERKAPENGTPEHAEWVEKMNRIHNVAELILAKQRHGPVGTLKLFFDSTLTKFRDLEKNDQVYDF
jgi:replicative DNA helicase